MIQFNQRHDLEGAVNHNNTEQISRLTTKVEDDSLRYRIIGKAVLLTAFMSKREQEREEGLYPSNSMVSKMIDASVSSKILRKVIKELKTSTPQDVCKSLEEQVEECRKYLETKDIATQYDRLYGIATHILTEEYHNSIFLERIGRRVETRLLNHRESDKYRRTIKELTALSSNGSPDAKAMRHGIKAVRILAEEEGIIRGALIYELRAG